MEQLSIRQAKDLLILLNTGFKGDTARPHLGHVLRSQLIGWIGWLFRPDLNDVSRVQGPQWHNLTKSLPPSHFRYRSYEETAMFRILQVNHSFFSEIIPF